MNDDGVISSHKLATQALCNSNDNLLNDAGFQVHGLKPDNRQPW
jgi:hypothetical protein